MKRVPPKANSLPAAYFELTKPSITFLILVSTALGYYLGAGGIDNWSRFFITLIGSGLVSSGAGALNHYAEQVRISGKYENIAFFFNWKSGLIFMLFLSDLHIFYQQNR